MDSICMNLSMRMNCKYAPTVRLRFENTRAVFRDLGGQLPAESIVEMPTPSRGFVGPFHTDHL